MFPNKAAMCQDTSILHCSFVLLLNPVLAEGGIKPGREESLLGAAWRHRHPSHCCHQGTESKGATCNPFLKVLCGAHPALRAQRYQQAELVVSSIRSEEKLEVFQRFLENAKEQMNQVFIKSCSDEDMGWESGSGFF